MLGKGALLKCAAILFTLFSMTLATQPLVGEIPASTLQVMPPMNLIYHPVSTTNKEAQDSFNQGLTYIFAFNHDIAFREFEKASKLDPSLAMAFWGMALALGQNVNEDVTPERELRCYEYIQKALKLSPNASKNEQDYISALATRYTNDPEADLIPFRFYYKNAMKKLFETYPEDLDAAAMYAESILNIDPWKWWTREGKPRQGTYDAIDTLEHVLMRNPEHIGANHYYIHSFEESPFPERALMSAHRLETLLPESGHLLHMPCHIFILVGDYESALNTSKKAVAADRKYIKENGMSGHYPLHYLSHNLYVQSRIYSLMEDYNNANSTAQELIEFASPHFKLDPHSARFSIVPLQVYLYFHKWNEILNYQLTAKTPFTQAFFHYCRATAFASLGKLDAAQKEKILMLQFKDQIDPVEEVSNNRTVKIIDLAETILDATFAKAQNNISDYIDGLRDAIKAQDRLFYDEPPAWSIPVRELLGAALLQQKNYSEAEDVFKQALNKLQRNGRLLYGLSLSLKGQGRTIEAYWVEREMTNALKHAPRPLTLDDL